MDLKTSTWPRRHAEQLAQLHRLLPESADRPLAVANVGPGLAVRYLGRIANRNTVVGDLVRRFETAVRRLPMPDACFENYEATELAAALDGRRFHLTAIDINPRVVRIVVKALAPNAAGVVADLGVANSPVLLQLRERFDVVFSFAMVARVRSAFADNARDNVRSLVRPGGLLVGGGEFGAGDIAPVEGIEHFFRRREAASPAA